MSITLRNPSNDPVPNRRFGDLPVSGVSVIRHLGNDYGWGGGLQVYAAADGVVSAINHDKNRKTNNRAGGYGNNIHIDHGNGYSTLYAHLPTSAPMVKVGQKVNAGNQIAVMGNTGNAAGVHLHFELRHNGAIIDPNPYIGKAVLTPANSGTKTPIPSPIQEEDTMSVTVTRHTPTGATYSIAPEYIRYEPIGAGAQVTANVTTVPDQIVLLDDGAFRAFLESNGIDQEFVLSGGVIKEADGIWSQGRENAKVLAKIAKKLGI